MKTKVLFHSMLAATLLVASACSETIKDEVEFIDPSSKTAITFVGQDNSARITRAGFAEQTQIAMHIRSTKDNSNIRETRTYVTAQKDATQDATSFSSITVPSGDNIRYWDDAYGRNAKLSVFAIAVPGKSDVSNDGKTLIDHMTGGSSWNAGALSEIIDWKLSQDQSAATTIPDEDLVYSNNIKVNGVGGAKAYDYTSNTYSDIRDGQLLFRLKDDSMQDGPGKFDQGNLKFDHALCRITVNLIKGTGYGDGSFKFAAGTNVKILEAPVSGEFNIETGTWDNPTRSGVTKMYTTETTDNAACTLVAQILPVFTIYQGKDDNILEFIIDDNKYFVTHDMMYNSLASGSVTGKLALENGHNYVFNITVGKSKIINVTATLEPWIDVTAADQTMDNSHITLDLFESNGTASSNFDLYRLNDQSAQINTGASTDKNWAGNYTEKATLNDAGSGKWETSWFFENNKSFYHFRIVNKDTEIKGSDSSVDDYFEITSGAQDGHDYHWGAPFIKTTTSPIQYDKANGYTDFLSPAIGATNSTINLTELHMMSNINVVLRTTKTSNAVELEVNTDQCEVSLTHFYANGQVKIGNGLVSTTGDLTDAAAFTKPAAGIDATDATYKKIGAFTFAAVPQTLVRNSGSELYVGITIKTPDNNQYYVVKKLSEIKATANGGSQNQVTDSKIDFWYPNHSYTYTFTLTKAGIDDVTCTVSDWVTVTADNQNISLED
jgi:hypothetical protein